MPSIKLQAPVGMVEYIDEAGRSFKPGTDGCVTVNATVHDLSGLFKAGFTQQPHAAGTTAQRPTATYAGLPYFDGTLGLPIWRNAANTGWIDASGTTR